MRLFPLVLKILIVLKILNRRRYVLSAREIELSDHTEIFVLYRNYI